MAVHLGIADENLINDMSFIFFEDVLAELGHKLIYDAVVNYAGNAFFAKSWEVISEHNPFNVGDGKRGNKAMQGLASLFNSGAAAAKTGKTNPKHMRPAGRK